MAKGLQLRARYEVVLFLWELATLMDSRSFVHGGEKDIDERYQMGWITQCICSAMIGAHVIP